MASRHRPRWCRLIACCPTLPSATFTACCRSSPPPTTARSQPAAAWHRLPPRSQSVAARPRGDADRERGATCSPIRALGPCTTWPVAASSTTASGRGHPPGAQLPRPRGSRARRGSPDRTSPGAGRHDAVRAWNPWMGLLHERVDGWRTGWWRPCVALVRVRACPLSELAQSWLSRATVTARGAARGSAPRRSCLAPDPRRGTPSGAQRVRSLGSIPSSPMARASLHGRRRRSCIGRAGWRRRSALD